LAGDPLCPVSIDVNNGGHFCTGNATRKPLDVVGSHQSCADHRDTKIFSHTSDS
jgi:hypothetical protein